MTTLYKYLPQIDLHGLDREYSKILINEFIRDNYELRNEKVLIIHGIGTGILKKTTHEVLKNNKLVESYKLDNFNSGTTVVEIRKKIWQFRTFVLEYRIK